MLLFLIQLDSYTVHFYPILTIAFDFMTNNLFLVLFYRFALQ